jgi:hypothetical protein
VWFGKMEMIDDVGSERLLLVSSTLKKIPVTVATGIFLNLSTCFRT